MEYAALFELDEGGFVITFPDFGWGVSQARRAWVEPKDVLNTRSRAELLAWLAQPKPRSSRVPSRG